MSVSDPVMCGIPIYTFDLFVIHTADGFVIFCAAIIADPVLPVC